MMWSQLKKRTEENFADSLKGRLEVFTTRYRESHDQEGEGWLVFDGKKVYDFGTVSYLVQSYKVAREIRESSGTTDFRNPDHQAGYRDAYYKADAITTAKGIFPLWDLNKALFEILNLSIEEAIASKSPIVRAFAIADKRFGKRRLKLFDDSSEHEFVKLMARIRKDAEIAARGKIASD